jgi:hypothetical protein
VSALLMNWCQPAFACCFSARCEYRAEAGVARVISDKVPVHKLSHLRHRDNLLAIEYRQQLFVCADVALILGILELVFANVLPKLFGQFGPGVCLFRPLR